jgi:hypothetical protein
MTKRMIQYWVIPPDADAEFVAHMEEVLETYEKAYDSAHPVLCMDEQPVQLLKEPRVPIEATWTVRPQRNSPSLGYLTPDQFEDEYAPVVAA